MSCEIHCQWVGLLAVARRQEVRYGRVTTCTDMTGCVPLAVGNVHRYRLLWIYSFGDGVIRYDGGQISWVAAYLECRLTFLLFLVL